MIALTRSIVKDVPTRPVVFGEQPLQVGMGGCPWRVAVASMLLCRSRWTQAAPVLQSLLTAYPNATALAVATDIEQIVRPCGLHRNRARQLARFSGEWLGSWWEDMRELTGVGIYVADSVGLFCFGCTDLESDDHVLRDYAQGKAANQAGLRHPQSQSGRTNDTLHCRSLP